MAAVVGVCIGVALASISARRRYYPNKSYSKPVLYKPLKFTVIVAIAI